ncbi:hypothetical protein L7F22_000277 [Adiantum nelumboides]|nr:hypothetical protein [Adiantum nelumboides]
MCNLQGLSRSSSIALLHDQNINDDTADPHHEGTAFAEPSSARLWAMVNDYLEMDQRSSTPKDRNGPMSRSGSPACGNNSKVSAAAAATLEKAIQEMQSVLGNPAYMGDHEESICNCVTAALHAEALAAGHVSAELVLPSMLRCLQGEAFKAALCVTERKLACATASLPPSGGHKYIDVIVGDELKQGLFLGQNSSERVIVDVGFCGHFEIARPLPAYQKLSAMLPSTFIGKADLLRRMVHIMCQAAKASLESQGMHIPPWRTFSFIYAKWFSSSCTRISSLEEASKIVLNGTSPSSGRGKTRIFVGRNCGSDPANATHPASDWAACSSASKRFPSQGDGAQAKLFWHISPPSGQISPSDQNGQASDDDSIGGMPKKREQSNVVSALAIALAETRCIHMLPDCVALAVKAHSRPQPSAAAAVSVL